MFECALSPHSLWRCVCEIIQLLLALETDISLLVIKTCFKVILSQNATLTTSLWFQSATSMGNGMNPVTGVVLIDAGLSCCVLAEKCFPNKGIIIPTYFCVSCSPDIQRVVMEIKHGPQGQGKLGLFTVLSASPPL